MEQEKTEVLTEVKEKDRNKLAKIAAKAKAVEMKSQYFQRRRNYLKLEQGIQDITDMIGFNEKTLKEDQAELDNGHITKKKPDGNIVSVDEMKSAIFNIGKLVKDQRLQLLYLKEDLYNMTEAQGVTVKEIQADVKKTYDEVNEFYKKNFE